MLKELMNKCVVDIKCYSDGLLQMAWSIFNYILTLKKKLWKAE